MLCPKCEKGQAPVLQSKPNGKASIRIRQCKLCRYKFRTEEYIIGPVKPNRKHTIRACNYCNTATKNIKFCSRECSSRARAAKLITIECKACGKRFTRNILWNRTYCSRDCGTSARRLRHA